MNANESIALKVALWLEGNRSMTIALIRGHPAFIIACRKIKIPNAIARGGTKEKQRRRITAINSIQNIALTLPIFLPKRRAIAEKTAVKSGR